MALDRGGTATSDCGRWTALREYDSRQSVLFNPLLMIQQARREVMMENWMLFLIFVGGGCLIGLVYRWLYIAPLDRENERGVKECLDKQARKRSGTVKASSRWSVLTIPYKSINIEVSVNEGMENPLEDYTLRNI